MSGQNVWLELFNSSTPYEFTGGPSLSGSLVLISSASVDILPPRTSLVISSPTFGAAPVYIATYSVLSLSATDDLRVLGDLSGVGVAKTFIAVDTTAFSLYGGTFTLAPGLHGISFYSVDRAGNTEQVHASSVAVDATPPVTSIAFGSPDIKAFGLDLIAPGTKISFNASDPIVAGVASGVSQTLFRVDGGSWAVWASSITLPEGTHAINYYSLDHLGNQEGVKSATVAVAGFIQGGVVAGVAGVSVSGNARAAGLVESDGPVSLSGNSSIIGNVSAQSVSKSGNASITGQTSIGQRPLVAEPIDLNVIAALVQGSTATSSIPGQYLSGGALNLSGRSSLALSSGVYVLSGLNLSGQASLSANGSADVLVQGPITVTGNAAITGGGLVLFSNSVQAVSLSGGAQCSGLLYAPLSNATITGSAQAGGPLFAGQWSFTGNAVAGTSGGASVLGPASYAAGIVTPQAPSYGSGELHVFGAGPAIMLHFYPGASDAAQFFIYDIGGRLVRQAALAAPVAIDYGKGPRLGYEYVWNTAGVRPGVYMIVASAKQGGHVVQKTAKTVVGRP